MPIKNILIVSLLFLLIPALDAQNLQPRQAGNYWVIAKSGLNLRQGPSTGSEVITTVPFGLTVEVTEAATAANMKVDNIRGGMAKVLFEGQEGYLFDGYLSKYPPPFMQDDGEMYADLIRRKVGDCLYEVHRKDWGGYIQEEEAVTLKDATWPEAFIIAQLLYGLPATFEYPGRGAGDQKITNPAITEYAWEDSLEVFRDDEGGITKLDYYYRAEGGGQAIVIEYEAEEGGLRISQILIAD